MRFVYVPFEEVIRADLSQSYSTYSIRCCTDASAPQQTVRCFHDVTSDAQFANDLARLCTESNLDPIHFMDVFYDLDAIRR